MRKAMALGITLAMVILTLALAGCGQKSKINQAPPPPPKPTANTPTTPPTPDTAANSATPAAPEATADDTNSIVASLEGKIKGIKSWQLKLISSEGEANEKLIISKLGDKMRLDNESEPDHYMLLSGNGEEMTIVDKSSKKAVKMKGGNEAAANEPELLKDMAAGFRNVLKDPQAKVSSDKLRGYDCWVITFNDAGEEQKLWADKEYGLPLRVETTKDGKSTTQDFEFSQINKVPESLFELPADYKVVNMDLSNPTSLSPGDLEQLKGMTGH